MMFTYVCATVGIMNIYYIFNCENCSLRAFILAIRDIDKKESEMFTVGQCGLQSDK